MEPRCELAENRRRVNHLQLAWAQHGEKKARAVWQIIYVLREWQFWLASGMTDSVVTQYIFF